MYNLSAGGDEHNLKFNGKQKIAVSQAVAIREILEYSTFERISSNRIEFDSNSNSR